MTTTRTIRKEKSTIALAGTKKENKQHQSGNRDRIFKSMTIISEGNQRIAAKWQKIEVYPYCD